MFGSLLPFLPFLILVVLVVVAISVFGLIKGAKKVEEEASPYEKKPFVFDVVSELNLYRLLIEIVGDKFYVFPQIGYSHLIQLKKGAERQNRNRFDKKTADFVLCEKERGVAKLVIELDGWSHQSDKRKERDSRVDAMMKQVGLPILHLKTENLSKDFIKEEIDRILTL